MRATLPAHVTLTADIAPVQADSRIATSLALLVNELVTNSARHAFPDAGAAGLIKLALTQSADGSVTMLYRDTGIGLPAVPTGTGLGTKVIASLAAQIAGTLTVAQGGPGHRVELTLSGPRD